MTSKNRLNPWLLRTGVGTVMATCSLIALAQTATGSIAPSVTESASDATNVLSLRRAFDAAWARQPEALALQVRRDAARAQQSAGMAWTPEPAALELSNKTDRLGSNNGAREVEVGISVPLWLPGERSRSAALADAEGAAVESRSIAAQLRLAATVREAWWQWQSARIEVASARDQLKNTRIIASDVNRRAKAGDLARADRHQADGAVATAEATLARAEGSLEAARQYLRGLVGITPGIFEEGDQLAEPDPGPATFDLDAHAALRELKDRAAVAERTAALTATQSRASPELMLATTRDRGARGEASQKSITLGIRVPFGAGPRSDARRAIALAEATEIDAQLTLERERLKSEQDAARARVEASRVQLAAAEKRAQLAQESRGFFNKSFQLGETDLPTRLRIESEAAEAGRQAARTRIELAAAISAWRQALGLLPQ